MRRTPPVLFALLAASCAATGLSATAEVTPTTATPLATLAPTTTVVPPTTSEAATTTRLATTTVAPIATPPSNTHTAEALTITFPASWVVADLLTLSPTEAAVTVRPLDSQQLTDQLTTLVDAGGIFWAEPANGLGSVTANALQSAPRPDTPDLTTEAEDIQRQLEASGAAIENFATETLTIGTRPVTRVTFEVFGLFGSVSQTQYLYAHASRVYVLTFATQNPDADQVLFASIAETVSFA